MDGDGSYDPRDIDRMIYTAIEGGYDEVIGCRTDKKNMPLLRRFGNKVISILISLLMGHRIKDPCSGMYLLRSDFARRLEIAATGFDVEAEIACKSMAHGRVAEVPVRYRRRIGESKLKTWTAGFRIIWTALKVSRLYNPISLFTTLGSLVGFSSLAILIWQLYVRYIFREEACSIGWTWLGLALLILGVNAFALAITSLMLKGMGREAHADISKKVL
jgi:dolichol-phosphate mannosyltransferase